MSANVHATRSMPGTVLGLVLLAWAVLANGGAAASPAQDMSPMHHARQSGEHHAIACHDPGGCRHHSDMTCCALAMGVGLVPAVVVPASKRAPQTIDPEPIAPARDRTVHPQPKPPNARS